MNKMCRTNIQSGRSMIEMLGVLASIGVLSVGGIAGYSKAMMKFKINKTIDQVSQIIANTYTFYSRYKNYSNLSPKIAYKVNLAPKEMFELSSGSYAMTNVFGGRVALTSVPVNDMYSKDDKTFALSFYGLPEEACIELSTYDWEASGIRLIYVSARHGEEVVSDDLYAGCKGTINAKGAIACAKGSVLSTPMPIDVAVDVCSGNNNSVIWKAY